MTENGTYASLRARIDEIPVVDSHEHMPDEKLRLGQKVDFFTLFNHYVAGDMVGATIPGESNPVERLKDPSLSTLVKWEIFAPFYDRLGDGSYARAAHIAMKAFYGMDRLTGMADAEKLTEAIREANTPGLYDRVLKDACNIVTVMNCLSGVDPDERWFRRVEFVTGLAELSMREHVGAVEALVGAPLTSLPRYVNAVGEYLEKLANDGLAGVKFHFAYMRNLNFRAVPGAVAERLFDRIADEHSGRRNAGIGSVESSPLQEYLVHRIIEIAGDLDLTVVFHTGIQATGRNNPDNARPERLWSLFNRYRHVRFNMLHAGLPWMNEAGMLAKYFGNVFVDMGWTHAISPELAVRALRVWIDMVPRNKILGFGGDYDVVEKVYGHLELAREDLARALAGKVDAGAMDEDRAVRWATALLHDNVIDAYALDIPKILDD